MSIPSDRPAGLAASLPTPLPTAAGATAQPQAETIGLRRQLLLECDAMARYAFASGLQVPSAIADGLEEIGMDAGGKAGAPEPTLSRIAALHGELAQVVTPATPRALYLLHIDPARDGWISMLGPLPTIRRLVVTSGIFTLLFLLTSLSEGINETTVAMDLYEMHGAQLLLVLLFVLSAAGLGACFHALFTVYRYVSACTYDPRHNASYWIRIGLGLIAGLVLAEVVPFDPDSGMHVITKPLLALLGGFSASLVYRILARLVDTVESLFKGDARDAAAVQEQQIRNQTSQEMARSRLSTAGQIVALRDEVAKGAGPGRISDLLTGVLDGLVPGLPAAKPAAPTTGSTMATGDAPAAADGGKLDELRGALGQGVAVARLAADLLPGEAGKTLGSLADKVQGGLDVVDALRNAGHVDGAVGQAGLLLDKVGSNDPLTGLLGDAVKTFGPILAGGPVAPLALVGAVVGLGARLGAAEYQRWTARVLNATYTPELFPAGTIDGTSVLAALRATTVFKSVFKPELDAGNVAALVDMAKDALKDDTGEALWEKDGSRFPSRQAFDEGLHEFRKALLDGDIRNDLPADAPELARAGGVDAVLQAVDRIDGNAPARADLDRIVLMARQMKQKGMDVAKLFADAAKSVEAAK